MSSVQKYSNFKLGHILDKLNYIENYGTGIPKIVLTYNDSTKNLNIKLQKIFLQLLCLILIFIITK